MKVYIRILMGILISVIFVSCEQYLDIKPNQSLAIPSTLKDLQALLNGETGMNGNYPDAGDIVSDYYYLNDSDWGARTDEVRETYIWHPEAQRNHWLPIYSRINYTNIILDAIKSISLEGMSELDRDRVKGIAHFFRGFSFLHLSNLYAPPYKIEENQGKLGIPLRLESDMNIASKRSSLDETYNQIQSDLKLAANLLPVSSLNITHPTKPTAFAALARTYLIMGDYKQAGLYADSCLALRSELMDYNDLNIKAAISFNVNNIESLLYALMDGSSGVFTQARAKVNPLIYDLYDENDLRKQMFFIENKDGTHSFKGNYAGRAPTSAYAGLAIDEVYLIRAECSARLGNTSKALDDLNALLVKRYIKGKFTPIQIDNKEDLLNLILNERKKELVFRGGIFWSDLRRLNLEPQFARDLVRTVQGKEYRLPANDLRYTFLIPTIVIQQTKLEQNSR